MELMKCLVWCLIWGLLMKAAGMHWASCPQGCSAHLPLSLPARHHQTQQNQHKCLWLLPHNHSAAAHIETQFFPVLFAATSATGYVCHLMSVRLQTAWCEDFLKCIAHYQLSAGAGLDKPSEMLPLHAGLQRAVTRTCVVWRGSYKYLAHCSVWAWTAQCDRSLTATV